VISDGFITKQLKDDHETTKSVGLENQIETVRDELAVLNSQKKPHKFEYVCIVLLHCS